MAHTIYPLSISVSDSNVQFMMAHSQESFSSSSPLQMSLPFSRGQAFIVSVLDSLLSLVINGVQEVRVVL